MVGNEVSDYIAFFDFYFVPALNDSVQSLIFDPNSLTRNRKEFHFPESFLSEPRDLNQNISIDEVLKFHLHRLR